MTRFVHITEVENVDVGEEPLGILVPTEEIACHLVDVPPVSRKKWQSMIPWLLEDRLLTTPESAVVAIGEKQGAQVPVVAADDEVVQAWRRTLKEQEVSYSCLVPDFFVLPWQAGTVSVSMKDKRWLLRYGRWQGAAGPEQLMAPLVTGLLNDSGLSVAIYGECNGANLPDWVQGAARHARIPERPLGKEASDWLSFARGEPVRRQTSWPLPGKIAAGLAGLSLLLLALMAWQESRQMEVQAEYFESQLRSGYRQYFGQQYDFAMEDFQRVVSAQLEGAGMGNPASSQLSSLADALRNCPQCRLEKLSFADGTVEALVSGERVKQQLGTVSVTSLVPKGDQWLLSLDGGHR